VFFVGDTVCELLQFSHPNVKSYAGKWPIRKSLVMTQYADLVIGPETGVLNAAAGLETPKILFLSHSTHENLSKHWINVTPLHSLVKCHPCHVLHFNPNSCPIDPVLKTPVCMTRLPAKMVYDAIEREYLKWKQQKPYGTNRYGRLKESIG
jgi:ADP-heptose:LPS heptosyltransferase